MLAVSRERGLLQLLHLELRCAGISLTSAESVAAAREEVTSSSYDAIVVDADLLPPRNPGGALEELKEADGEATPMLMLLGQDTKNVRLWRDAVDDYVLFPADASAVADRVRALMNRTNPAGRPLDQLETGPLRFDFRRRRAFRDGDLIRLRENEWWLLHLLACADGEPIAASELLEAIWGSAHQDDTPLLTAWVRQLRRHLEDDPTNPRLIQGNAVDGYRFVPGGENPADDSYEAEPVKPLSLPKTHSR